MQFSCALLIVVLNIREICKDEFAHVPHPVAYPIVANPDLNSKKNRKKPDPNSDPASNLKENQIFL